METATAAVRDYEYYKRIFAPLPKPLAYVDLDLLDETIQRIAQGDLDKVPKPYLPRGLKLLPNKTAGEVQTVKSSTPCARTGGMANAFFKRNERSEHNE